MAKGDAKGAVHGKIRPKWFAPAAALLVLAAAGGLVAGYDALGAAEPNTSLGWGAVGGAVGALVLAGLLALATRKEIKVDAKTITVRSGLGQSVKIEWSEPHDYYYLAVSDSSTPSVEKARVQTPDGRRIDVDETILPEFPRANVPGLVERYSAAANLPKIKARLEEGEDVEFGPVSMSVGHVKIEDTSHSVEESLVLHIKRGCLQVGVDGEWVATKVSVHDVANYPCLLRVIGQLTQARPPG